MQQTATPAAATDNSGAVLLGNPRRQHDLGYRQPTDFYLKSCNAPRSLTKNVQTLLCEGIGWEKLMRMTREEKRRKNPELAPNDPALNPTIEECQEYYRQIHEHARKCIPCLNKAPCKVNIQKLFPTLSRPPVAHA